jgi:hypothetical protein
LWYLMLGGVCGTIIEKFQYYHGGGQGVVPRSDEFNAGAVRNGDVGPAPAAAWFLGSGLIGLVALRRRFNGR